jgi:hypothetical protein
MAFWAGNVRVRCPMCGWPVALQVKVESVAAYPRADGGPAVIQATVRAEQEDNHPCGPPQGDGRDPIERFTADGHLDDLTLSIPS